MKARAQRYAGNVLHHRSHFERPGAFCQHCAADGRSLLRRKQGPAIGHISPEAAQGGPIALIEENDLIEIDIPQRILRVIGINGKNAARKKVQRVFNERRKALPPFRAATRTAF